MYVLDTDYETFAIQYACIEMEGIFNIGKCGFARWLVKLVEPEPGLWISAYALILTRERLPTSDVIQDTQKYAELSGLEFNKMIPIFQSACPKDV